MLKRTSALAVACVLALAGCGANHPANHPAKASAPTVTQSAMGSVAPAGWGSVHQPAPKGPTAAQTREQFDTITLSTVPAGAQFLAGYVDGRWSTFGSLVRAHPAAKVKSIAVFYGDSAACGDFEPGDMDPSQAVAWFHFEQTIARVFKPCIYSSYWEFVNQIIPALSHAGISRAAYWAWDADYVYVSRIDSGFDCTQWNNHAYGLNLDESTCTLAFLGVSPPKPPPPKPPVKQVCFGRKTTPTPGCLFVQREVAAWRKQAATDLANATRVTKRWS